MTHPIGSGVADYVARLINFTAIYSARKKHSNHCNIFSVCVRLYTPVLTWPALCYRHTGFQFRLCLTMRKTMNSLTNNTKAFTPSQKILSSCLLNQISFFPKNAHYWITIKPFLCWWLQALPFYSQWYSFSWALFLCPSSPSFYRHRWSSPSDPGSQPKHKHVTMTTQLLASGYIIMSNYT